MKIIKLLVPLVCLGLAACGGGSSSSIPSHVASTPTPVPTATPVAVSFNDYTTFGYDNQRDDFNPNSTTITPANVPLIHLAWQASLDNGGDFSVQTQPILATEISGHAGVLFVGGGGSGNVYAYDATTGKLLWTTFTGIANFTCAGSPTLAQIAIGGTVAYDASSKSLYVAGNSNTSVNGYSANTLYHLDATTGKILGQVAFGPTQYGIPEQNFTHTAVTLSNGLAYVGTSSTCDISSWRGTVTAISVPAMTVANQFFPVWDPNNTRGQGTQPWSGAGVWGWGGVSVDNAGHILTGTGNADLGNSNGMINAPFVVAPTESSGYAESLLELTPGALSVVASNHPTPATFYNSINGFDLDVNGTPTLFTPTGCGTMVALQAKSGQVSVYNESAINSGPLAQYQTAPPTGTDANLGGPAYSPITGLLYTEVSTSASPTLFPSGMVALNFDGCGAPSAVWHTGFGLDSTNAGISRSVPAVSAGGVVFAGSASNANVNAGSLWALNATTGAVLNAATPILQTSANLRVPVTIDGKWMFVIDTNGNLYGLTTDTSYPKITAIRRAGSKLSIKRSHIKPPSI